MQVSPLLLKVCDTDHTGARVDRTGSRSSMEDWKPAENPSSPLATAPKLANHFPAALHFLFGAVAIQPIPRLELLLLSPSEPVGSRSGSDMRKG